MANRHRGEVDAVIGGRRFTLCLTLGALAELEASFGVGDLDALGRRFAEGRLAAHDLARLLGAMIRGGGTPLSDEEVAALPLAGGLDAVVRVIGDVMRATFAPGAEAAPARPSVPQDANPSGTQG